MRTSRTKRWIEGHPLTWTNGSKPVPNRLYDPSRFVTPDEGRDPPAGAAILAMDVTAADATSFDTDQHIVRAHLRLRHVAHLKITGTLEKQCFHRLKNNL